MKQCTTQTMYWKIQGQKDVPLKQTTFTDCNTCLAEKILELVIHNTWWTCRPWTRNIYLLPQAPGLSFFLFTWQTEKSFVQWKVYIANQTSQTTQFHGAKSFFRSYQSLSCHESLWPFKNSKVHKISKLVPIWSQMHPAHSYTQFHLDSFEYYSIPLFYSLVSQAVPSFQAFSLKFCMKPSPLPTCSSHPFNMTVLTWHTYT